MTNVDILSRGPVKGKDNTTLDEILAVKLDVLVAI